MARRDYAVYVYADRLVGTTYVDGVGDVAIPMLRGRELAEFEATRKEFFGMDWSRHVDALLDWWPPGKLCILGLGVYSLNAGPVELQQLRLGGKWCP